MLIAYQAPPINMKIVQCKLRNYVKFYNLGQSLWLANHNQSFVFMGLYGYYHIMCKLIYKFKSILMLFENSCKVIHPKYNVQAILLLWVNVF
jgi:hypothetical protein